MKTRDLILTALFAALTAVGAFLRIPTPLSSFTLQVFFTCMAGVLLGPKYGALSQAVYVVLGLIGLPIFTSGGGPSSILTPTFGFLLGLPPMAAVAGALTRKFGSTFAGICAACAVGLAVLYVIGLPYMHLIVTLYLQKQQSIWQSVKGGMLIFLPWDALKIVVTGAIGVRLLPRLATIGAAANRVTSNQKTAQQRD